jgi:hypothetical protein
MLGKVLTPVTMKSSVFWDETPYIFFFFDAASCCVYYYNVFGVRQSQLYFSNFFFNTSGYVIVLKTFEKIQLRLTYPKKIVAI